MKHNADSHNLSETKIPFGQTQQTALEFQGGLQSSKHSPARSLLAKQHMDQRHSGGGSCTGFTQPERSAVSGQRYVSRGEDSTRSVLMARTRLAILTTSVHFEYSVFRETDIQAPCLSTSNSAWSLITGGGTLLHGGVVTAKIGRAHV